MITPPTQSVVRFQPCATDVREPLTDSSRRTTELRVDAKRKFESGTGTREVEGSGDWQTAAPGESQMSIMHTNPY